MCRNSDKCTRFKYSYFIIQLYKQNHTIYLPAHVNLLLRNRFVIVILILILYFITMYNCIAFRANTTWGESQVNNIRHYHYIHNLDNLWVYLLSSSKFGFLYSLSSFAILDGMFFKAIEVPDIHLKCGSLQISISHCTRLSCLASPWTQKR